jgi:hypothetical protein
MAKGKAESYNTRQDASVEQGNSYQAGGNIYINSSENPNSPKEESKPKRLDTWQKVVGIIVGITVIITFLLFTFPEKMGRKPPVKQVPLPQDSIFVTGIIRAKGADTGIPNAWVTNNLTPGDTILTTSHGTFELWVPGKAGQSIRIYTGAKGYDTTNEYHTLPKAIDISLKKK